MWHRHKWKVKEKVEQPSVLDELIKTKLIKLDMPPHVDIASITARRFVVTYVCAECGTEQVRRV